MASLKKIPFSYHWILRRAIGDDVSTVLDLGCGEGDLMDAISEGENWKIVGVELHKDAFIKAKKSGVYQEVIKASVAKLPKNILNKKYDVVFSSQVLEHLIKKQGLEALKQWERLAKKCIVISTPVGFIKYEPLEKKNNNNPLQEHLSGWKPEEFEKKGYTVRGQGFKLVYGERGLARRWPSLLPVLGIISYLLAPLVYFYPKIATYMVAWEDVNND